MRIAYSDKAGGEIIFIRAGLTKYHVSRHMVHFSGYPSPLHEPSEDLDGAVEPWKVLSNNQHTRQAVATAENDENNSDRLSSKQSIEYTLKR